MPVPPTLTLILILILILILTRNGKVVMASEFGRRTGDKNNPSPRHENRGGVGYSPT